MKILVKDMQNVNGHVKTCEEKQSIEMQSNATTLQDMRIIPWI